MRRRSIDRWTLIIVVSLLVIVMLGGWWLFSTVTSWWTNVQDDWKYGSIRTYLASFPDARSAAGALRRRFKFLGDTGVWRLLTSAARDV